VLSRTGRERVSKLLGDLHRGAGEVPDLKLPRRNGVRRGIRRATGDFSRRRLTRAQYVVVIFQTKMMEIKRKMKYLRRSQRSATVGFQSLETHFLSRLCSTQLRAWKPWA
jgi:hypothetical protein